MSDTLNDCITKAIHDHEGNRLMLTHFQAECLAKAALNAIYGEGYKILKLTPLYTGTPAEAARECAGND